MNRIKKSFRINGMVVFLLAGSALLALLMLALLCFINFVLPALAVFLMMPK